MEDKDFKELLSSIHEMDGIITGEIESSREFEFAEPEVKSIRDKIGLSQTRFAGLIGVSKRTLENWEQGRRHSNWSKTTKNRSFFELTPFYCL